MVENIDAGPHIPGKDRMATLTLIWTKQGQIHSSYPTEPHMSLPMLAVGLDSVIKGMEASDPDEQKRSGFQVLKAVAVLLRHCAEVEKMSFVMKQHAQGQEQPLIVPATNIPPGGIDPSKFDPRFIRKPN